MLVPAQKTVIDMRGYAHAVLRAWKLVEGSPYPSKASVAVLWAQYIIETGGKACWNWNVGNVKHVDGDGFDYTALRGVWEGVSPAEAQRLIASGQAYMDNDPNHIRAVPRDKVPVVFNPPHPATFFRAYQGLDVAMQSHLSFLKNRYGAAWEKVKEGDYDAFAHALKAGRDGKEGTWDDYFTADAGVYARGMAPAFHTFMQSSVFDEELAALVATLSAPTAPSPPEDDQDPMSTRFVDTDDMPIIHPPVPLGRPGLDDDEDV